MVKSMSGRSTLQFDPWSSKRNSPRDALRYCRVVTNRRPASASGSTGSGAAGAAAGASGASDAGASGASGAGSPPAWRTKAGKLWRPSANDSASIRQSRMYTASARNSPCNSADHTTDRLISPAVRNGRSPGFNPPMVRSSTTNRPRSRWMPTRPMPTSRSR